MSDRLGQRAVVIGAGTGRLSAGGAHSPQRERRLSRARSKSIASRPRKRVLSGPVVKSQVKGVSRRIIRAAGTAGGPLHSTSLESPPAVPFFALRRKKSYDCRTDFRLVASSDHGGAAVSDFVLQISETDRFVRDLP